MERKNIRQPIVTVVGHVDHGKTSILDSLRGTSVQEKESGGITQKISFTLFPRKKLKSACPLIEQKSVKVDIPGFLFIDTPGHAAFTNLRKRGGSLADLAVLVIDINEGIKPQTAEVIQILKRNKVPFIIALNKIDKIPGWRTDKNTETELKGRIESQDSGTKQRFDEQYLTLIGSLQSHGFDAELYYNIEDFRKKIALVPCSAKTKEGISELIFVLCGLSQKFLGEKLNLGKEAKGIVLEIKKGQAQDTEAILYDGQLSKGDEIAVAGFDGKAIVTKIRVLEEILPLSSKFKAKENVQAATGLRMQIVDKESILPGMPFIVYKNNKEEVEKVFKEQITENIKTDKQGVIAKADSLGSLEALLTLLKEAGVPIVRAGIGSINKNDVARAKANLEINELDSVIVGFNTGIDEEAEIMVKQNRKIKVITEDVIYKLIESLAEWREEKRKDIEKIRLLELSALCKLKLLKQYVFKNTSPAIFGVKVEAGKIIPGISMIDEHGETVGKIKNLQLENKSVTEASEGQELAISIPGINYERRMKSVSTLYADIGESQFRHFKKNKDLLSVAELRVLQEIAEIKRKGKEGWGQ